VKAIIYSFRNKRLQSTMDMRAGAAALWCRER